MRVPLEAGARFREKEVWDFGVRLDGYVLEIPFSLIATAGFSGLPYFFARL
jgi:hypothetical protein